jgi:hypothetical protein
MPEWIRWTDVSFVVIVLLAFTVCMKHCFCAQRKMRRVSTATHSKPVNGSVEHAPAKWA